MASYNELNALIDAYINRNGVQAITGQILNGVLKAMVEQLGRGYTIMGAAIPTTDPGTPDGPECYFASETGTYTDFDGLQVAPGELALLCYTPSDGWTKATIYEGFRQVGATIDGNVGTPSVGVSYANGVLSFDFHNMKGNPGQNGQDGAAAGFGTIGADIAGGVGTPAVTVESSGPATAKNLQFHFTNLKGETGVTSVVATVDNTTGTPACTVSLDGQQLTLAFSGLKGAQGDTGSSVDYPFTIVNNLTTDDATQALSAAQGVVLQGEITQLEAEVNGFISWIDGYFINASTLQRNASGYFKYSAPIYLKSGRIVSVLSGGSGVSFVTKSNENGDFLQALLSGTSSSQTSYSYTIPQDGYYVLCYKYLEAGASMTVDGTSAEMLVSEDSISARLSGVEHEVDEVGHEVDELGHEVSGFTIQIDHASATGLYYTDVNIPAGSNIKMTINRNGDDYTCYYQFINAGGTAFVDTGTVQDEVYLTISQDATRFRIYVESGHTSPLNVTIEKVETLEQIVESIAPQVKGENWTRTYKATAGKVLNTTTETDRLVVDIKAGETAKFKVDFPLWTAHPQLSFYNGNTAVKQFNMVSGGWREYTAAQNITNVRLYLLAPSVTLSGPVTISIVKTAKIREYAEGLVNGLELYAQEYKSGISPVVSGSETNTTTSDFRFYKNVKKGKKFRVKVDYPEGDASLQIVIYPYKEDGTSLATFATTNGQFTEKIASDNIASFGYNITAAGATANGTSQMTLSIDGELDALEERVDALEENWTPLRLSDVLYHWMNGEKFPIGFQGDSTTDGVSTTGWTVDNSHPAQDTAAGGRGKADYVCELAYPKQLENLLRAELGSSTLRVYNIGYYGASLANNENQLEDIYSDAYADVKMVGIVLGINDRGAATDAADFYNDVVSLLITYVDFFIGKGITPFMVTNQVVTQCGNDPNTTSYSALYQDYIQTLCNEAKRYVAKKYNLEIIEMNAFGRLLLESSDYAYDDITEDLHFKDLGHKLEAGFLFSEIIPWVNKTDDAKKLYFGFNCAKCKTDFRIGAIETTTNDKFKLQVNTAQDTATDKCIFDAYMFNNSKNGAYSVKYLTPVASGYIVVDGDTANTIQITATEMNLGTWDIGLHHIQVYTGESTTVAFKGFLLESVS